MERPTEEITEIERHKYFLSEKQGYDVGWEAAEQDWEENFAEQWRRQWEQADWQGRDADSCAADAACCNTSRVIHMDPPSRPAGPVGSLKRLFSRLLSKSTSS